MARQDINLGTAPTGAGGDTTRSTGVKINAMTAELYSKTNNMKSAAYADLVGSVTQSGGVPTGAIIERGSNASGEFVKFADGSLFCFTKSLTLTYAAATYLAANWTYPAAYSAPPQVFASQVAVVNAFKYNRGVPGASGDTAYAAVRVFATGTDIYSSGESTAIQVFAVGRWF